MTAIHETLLYQTPGLEVVHRTCAGPRAARVAVTFTTWVPNPALNLKQGFAEGAFLKAGIDEILVKNARNDWYQSDEVAAALACVSPVLAGYDQVISYGASMGGYACLNFSDVLRASRSVAVSPQFSVDPRKAAFETRWQSDVEGIRFTHDDVNGSLHPGTRHLILFDPQSRDAHHARLIDGARVERLGLRHSGHFTLNTIKDLDLLGRFFRCVTDDQPDLDGFISAYQQRIKDSSWRVLSLAERSIRSPLRLRALWRRFRAAPPRDPIPFEKMALYLILARSYSEALEALDALPVLALRPYALSLRARALAGSGDAASARAEARRVADLVGREHDYWRQLRSLGIAA